MSHGLIAAHDDQGVLAGRRVLALSGPTGGIRLLEPGAVPEPAEIETDLQELPGGDAYMVVHLSTLADPAALKAACHELEQRFEHFPKAVLRQWLVLAVGQQLDDAERVALAELEHHRHNSRALTGIVLVGRATQESAAHDTATETAFAADVAWCLLATDLAERQLSTRITWAISSCSLVYDRQLLRDAVAALLASAFVRDRLLADPTKTDPLQTARAVAEDWVRDLGVGTKEEEDVLLRSSRGTIRQALAVKSIQLPWKEVEYWPDRLASWFQLLSMGRLPAALVQVDENVAAHEATLRAAFTERILADLRAVPVVGRAQIVVEGLADALREAEALMPPPSAAPGEDELGLDDLMAELEEAIQRLPHPPAVVLRAGLLGIVLAVLGSLVVISGGRYSFLAGALGASVALVWGAGKYLRRALRVVRARDNYLSAATNRLMGTVLRHLTVKRLAMLASLRDWLVGTGGEAPADPEEGAVDPLIEGSVLKQLRTLATSAEDALRQLEALAEKREGGDFQSTELAVTLPTAEDVPTTSLVPGGADAVHGDDRELGPALFASTWVHSSEGIVRACLERFAGQVEDVTWTTLGDLLDRSESTRTTAARLLDTDTTPLLQRAGARAQPDSSNLTYHPSSMPAPSTGSPVPDEDGLAALFASTSKAGRRRMRGTFVAFDDEDKLISLDIVRLDPQGHTDVEAGER